MPNHKFACQQGVLHIRMTDVHQLVTKEMLREEFSHFGGGNLLCAFERVVDGMYGVEAYVEFRSVEGGPSSCCFGRPHSLRGVLFPAVEAVPLIYNAISTPDDDEFAPPYFYNDTPYSAWAAADSASTSPEIPMSATTPVASASCDIIEDNLMPIYDILAGGTISTTSTTAASVCAATSTELPFDSTPTSVPVKAATDKADHDSAMPTTSSPEGL